jgi:hypothetical protein
MRKIFSRMIQAICLRWNFANSYQIRAFSHIRTQFISITNIYYAISLKLQLSGCFIIQWIGIETQNHRSTIEQQCKLTWRKVLSSSPAQLFSRESFKKFIVCEVLSFLMNFFLPRQQWWSKMEMRTLCRANKSKRSLVIS